MMKITQNEVIDPTFRGNQARFINHSCDPNCITQKWNVLGETVVGVFAIKDIREGMELSFDYQGESQLNEDNQDSQTNCCTLIHVDRFQLTIQRKSQG